MAGKEGRIWNETEHEEPSYILCIYILCVYIYDCNNDSDVCLRVLFGTMPSFMFYRSSTHLGVTAYGGHPFVEAL